ncbi:ZIP family metal transporter [Olivibacter domesticus]|uniref:Zinc transporter, ZIP family n=1 Tax=Olivibacter domesticus TaxID=407022 RepID=A0A1H7MTT4_OLID1|nr:hypothetical protein [Olivibacter domesticus]SEL14700.1 zinc transporter, ZIP family [Olivibacter domesticus]
MGIRCYSLMSEWLEAGFWGLLSGSALIVGALMGYFFSIPQKTIALIMGFGAGVLISALAFDLMDEAFSQGGFLASASGFLAGGGIYSIANYFLDKKGAKHRKRSLNQQPSESDQKGSGLAIALGALLDGIPEAIAIGVSMIEGGAVSIATVLAIFISNIPEGLSSSSGMKNAGRSRVFVFSIWIGIALITGIASLVGYTVFSHLSPEVIAVTLGIAAGAILAMLADTMMPEAFEKGHNLAGIITVLGFLTSFLLSKLG